MGRKSVKYNETVFEELKADQQNGETWDQQARRLLEASRAEFDPEQLLDRVEAAERAAEQARDAAQRTRDRIEAIDA